METQGLAGSVSDQGSKASRDVQTKVDVVVKLARRRCWRWQIDRMDYINKWKVEIDSEVLAWLFGNNITYKRYILLNKAPKGSRDTNDVYFVIPDKVAARTFILAWDLDLVSRNEFDELMLKNQKTRRKSVWKK